MKKNLKYYLKDKLSEKEIRLMPTSFDVVGDILIFSDFPKELSKKEKIIGKTILRTYHHIKTILKKTKKYSGRFRTPKLKIIAGEKRKETTHKENNVFIKLDVEKVYFSARMSSERKRIADLIKPNESVLVMFSGAAPYPLVIANNTKCKEVYGIEINPTAHKYALENIKTNKLENKIKVFLGDVTKIMPKINKKFGRILMPLPKGAESFLGISLKYIKKNGIIHFYDFLHEDEFEKAHEKIKKACIKSRKNFKLINIVKCGQYSPGFYRICIDFKIY
ncbi:MAG TPA: class I SAM-dependent methyltransferase family protein [Candidatus Nanoarchaeia archaeon]|nr:class I SAM-dependent methyltransferase family protein [Candidatus Nanoarchaeia archaeon]